MANIVFTEKFYVNYSIRNESTFNEITKQYDTHKTKLGFATYYEDNAAFRKRQATIDRWAGASQKSDLVDNVPRSGYILSKSVTHGGDWNATTVNWRIVDPLGFELEVSSGNLSRIIQYCTIEKGAILGECVWGWDKANGSKIVLLPIDCDLYKSATQTTARHFASTIPVADVQIGDQVEYKNGQIGTYMGKLKYVTVSYSSSNLGEVEINQQHCLEIEPGTLYLMKTPVITGATTGKKHYTVDEAETYLNDYIRNNTTSILSAGSSWGASRTCFFAYDKKPVVQLVAKLSNKIEFMTAIRDVYKRKNSGYLYNLQSEMQPFIVTGKDGHKYYVADFEHEILGSGRSHQATLDFMNGVVDDLDILVHRMQHDDLQTFDLMLNPSYQSNYNSYSYTSRPPKFIEIKMKLSDMVDFHTIEAQYKTWTYNLHSVR